VKKATPIRLRPYHPTYVIGFFGAGGMKEGYNRHGFNYVIEQIKANPNIKIEFVEEYDDICKRCENLKPSEKGSVWGKQHTCSSAENPVVVEKVKKANEQILKLLGLKIGSLVAFKDLVLLMRARLPDIGKSGIDMIGGAEFQEKYEKGLATVSALWP